MSKGFYVTLVSNASSDLYPDNNPLSFTNEVAYPIEIPQNEEWKVCLHSLSMQNSIKDPINLEKEKKKLANPKPRLKRAATLSVEEEELLYRLEAHANPSSRELEKIRKKELALHELLRSGVTLQNSEKNEEELEKQRKEISELHEALRNPPVQLPPEIPDYPINSGIKKLDKNEGFWQDIREAKKLLKSLKEQLNQGNPTKSIIDKINLLIIEVEDLRDNIKEEHQKLKEQSANLLREYESDLRKKKKEIEEKYKLEYNKLLDKQHEYTKGFAGPGTEYNKKLEEVKTQLEVAETKWNEAYELNQNAKRVKQSFERRLAEVTAKSMRTDSKEQTLQLQEEKQEERSRLLDEREEEIEQTLQLQLQFQEEKQEERSRFLDERAEEIEQTLQLQKKKQEERRKLLDEKEEKIKELIETCKPEEFAEVLSERIDENVSSNTINPSHSSSPPLSNTINASPSPPSPSTPPSSTLLPPPLPPNSAATTITSEKGTEKIIHTLKKENETSKNVISVHLNEINPVFGKNTSLSIHMRQDYNNKTSFVHHNQPLHKQFFPLESKRINKLSVNIKNGRGENLRVHSGQPTIIVLYFKRMKEDMEYYTLRVRSHENPEENKAINNADFQAHLPRTMSKDGGQSPWEMALASITYSPHFEVFTNRDEKRFMGLYNNRGDLLNEAYNNEEKFKEMVVNNVMSGFTFKYTDLNPHLEHSQFVAWVLRLFNVRLFSSVHPAAKPSLLYDREKDKFSITSPIEILLFIPSDLCYTIGAREETTPSKFMNGYWMLRLKARSNFEFSHAVDYKALSPENLMIYANCVEESVIGGAFGQLLTTFPVERETDNNHYFTYEPRNLEFHKIIINDLSNINFQLRTLAGDLCPFVNNNNLEIYMSLMFRRKRK